MIYITAISPSHSSAEHHITSVRWLAPHDGTAATMTVAAVAEWLDASESNVAKVAGEYGPSFVGVYERGGKKYLRSYADGEFTNNLLSLPYIR